LFFAQSLKNLNKIISLPSPCPNPLDIIKTLYYKNDKAGRLRAWLKNRKMLKTALLELSFFSEK
ncbi:MAG: hypothetical protein ACE5J5_06365, partial [Candidatus Hydrothermarchaeales archaeon]